MESDATNSDGSDKSISDGLISPGKSRDFLPIFRGGKSGKSKSNKVMKDWPTFCHPGNDQYRTCLNQHGGCDMIASSKPNLAKLEGTMHLALLQDDTLVTCDRLMELEEILLTYLADNIGSDDTYSPACIHIDEYAHAKQAVPGDSKKFVESTAFETELTFIQRQPWQKLRKNQRERKLSRCNLIERALCCSQNTINHDVGAYCINLGCTLSRCGGKRRPWQKMLRRGRALGSKAAYLFPKSRTAQYYLFDKSVTTHRVGP